MRISVASDHAGYPFKEKLAAELRSQGHQVKDFGTDSETSCDYPDFGIPAARSVVEGAADRAILCCSNGIGMSMLANRIPGVRGALVYSSSTAERTRQHHDSNVLCLGAQEFADETLLEWVSTWLRTAYEAGRHARRIGKIEALDGA